MQQCSPAPPAGPIPSGRQTPMLKHQSAATSMHPGMLYFSFNEEQHTICRRQNQHTGAQAYTQSRDIFKCLFSVRGAGAASVCRDRVAAHTRPAVLLWQQEQQRSVLSVFVRSRSGDPLLLAGSPQADRADDPCVDTAGGKCSLAQAAVPQGRP